MTNLASAESRATIKALAMGIAALLLGLQISGWIGFIRVIRDGHADFRAYYAAGYQIRAGQRHEIYDYQAEKSVQDSQVSPESSARPYIHPSFEALLFAPFSLLSYRWGFAAFLAANLAVLAVVCRIFCSQLPELARVWAPLPVALVVCFLGTAEALMQGQDSILLLLILSGAALALQSGSDLSAGFLLSLGLFRFQFVLPIAILFFLWKRWTLIRGFSIGATAVALVSVLVSGVDSSKMYLRTLSSLGSNAPGAYEQPIWLMPSLRGLIHGLFSSFVSDSALRWITIILSVAVIAWLGWRQPGRAQFEIAIVAAALLSYHLLPHDLTALLIPIGVTLKTFLVGASRAEQKPTWSGCFAVAVYLSPVLLIAGTRYFFLTSLVIFGFLICLVHESRVPSAQIRAHYASAAN